MGTHVYDRPQQCTAMREKTREELPNCEDVDLFSVIPQDDMPKDGEDKPKYDTLGISTKTDMCALCTKYIDSGNRQCIFDKDAGTCVAFEWQENKIRQKPDAKQSGSGTLAPVPANPIANPIQCKVAFFSEAPEKATAP